MTLNVTIWNEFRHEKTNEEARKVYPDGLHEPIADHLRSEGMTVRAAATSSRKDRGVVLRRIRLRVDSDPDCKGRCR